MNMWCSHTSLPICNDLAEGSMDAAQLQATGFILKLSNCYVIYIIQSLWNSDVKTLVHGNYKEMCQLGS